MKEIYREIVFNSSFGYCYNKVLLSSSGQVVDFEFVEANEEFKRITGTKRKHIIGKNFSVVFPAVVKREKNWLEKFSHVALEGGTDEFEFYSPLQEKWYRIKIKSLEKYYFAALLIDITDEIKISQYARNFLHDRGEKLDYQKLTDDLFQITNAAVIAFNILDDENQTSTTYAISSRGKVVEKAAQLLKIKFLGHEWKLTDQRFQMLKGHSKLYFPRATDFLKNNIPDRMVKVIFAVTFNNPIHVFSVIVKDEIVGDFIILEKKKENLKNVNLIEIYTQLIGLVLNNRRYEMKFSRISEDLELLMEATENGFWDYDFIHDKVVYNDQYFTMLGYGPKDLPRTPEIWFSLMHPHDRKTVMPKIQELISKGIPYKKMFRLRCKDGKWKWVLGKGKGFAFDSKGKPRRALGIHVDVDNLVNLKEQLASSENHYKALFEYSPTPLLETDFSGVKNYIETLKKTGMEDLKNYFFMYPFEVLKALKLTKIINLNNAATGLFKVKKEDELKNGFFKLIPEASFQQFAQILLAIAQHESYCNLDVTAYDLEGSRRVLHVFWKVIPGYEPNLKKVFVAIVNITDRVQAIHEIKETKERLKSIHAAIPDMIFEIDRDCKLIYYKEQDLQDFQTPKIDYIGKNIQEILPENIAKNTQKYIEKTFGEKRIQHYEFQMEVRGDENYFEMRLIPEDDQKALAVVRNITEQVRLKKENEQLEKYRNRSRKLDTIGTLAAGIAHDFNNLLTPILGYADMIRQMTDKKDSVHDDASEIFNAAVRGKILVRQISSFSPTVKQKMAKLSVNEVVAEALQEFYPTLSENIEIDVKIEDNMPHILGDKEKLKEVVKNLLTNAWQALENQKGKITVELNQIFVKSRECSIYPDLSPGNYLQLIIADTGSGMEERVIDRIFEPFFSTREVGQGTGMGLSVVYGIVKSHNGMIHVHSEPGEGSVFSIFFPITAPGKPEEGEEIFTGRGTIMVVDDKPYITKMLEQILGYFGYKTLSFNDSAEAWKVYKNKAKTIDLVITDRNMSDMDGLEFANRISNHKKSTPVILLTGSGYNISSDTIAKSSISRLIQKPVLVKELIESVRSILEEGPNEA